MELWSAGGSNDPLTPSGSADASRQPWKWPGNFNDTSPSSPRQLDTSRKRLHGVPMAFPSPSCPRNRCGNVAAILELDENLNKQFRVFKAAPQDSRGAPAKKPPPDYFL